MPDNLWRIEIVSAEIPRLKRSGLPWDDDGDPDPFVKLFIDGRRLWESPVIEDELHPEFAASPPKNLRFDRSSVRLRLELWDRDGVGNDPIGIYEGRALTDAIVDAESILKLEGGATMTIKVRPPTPHVGTGIALYEVHKDALIMIELLPSSPASRAGLLPGDRVIALDGRSIAELAPQKAESGLALAAQKTTELTVRRGDETIRINLEPGYIWLAM